MAWDNTKLVTPNGHSLFTMSSMMHKAIRRCEPKYAGYAANELWNGGYVSYLWKWLFIISAEDCYGIMTKELIALKEAEDLLAKGGKERVKIFASKAITLLLYARKNRDADYFGCNFMLSNKIVDGEEYIRMEDQVLDIIPEYTFDVHTREGRAKGKTVQNMVEAEQRALCPKQVGLWDDASWELHYEDEKLKKK